MRRSDIRDTTRTIYIQQINIIFYALYIPCGIEHTLWAMCLVFNQAEIIGIILRIKEM